MKNLLLIITLAIPFVLMAQKKSYFDQNWEPCEKSDASYYRIVKEEDGAYRVYDFYMSGALQFETLSKTAEEPFFYLDKATWYHADGSVQSEVGYLNNVYHGEVKRYYENGNLWESMVYENGVLNGEVSRYYENGNLRERSEMENSEFIGKSEGYFENGNKQFEGSYNEDGAQGAFKRYYRDGQLKSSGNFKDDRKNGKWSWYFANGKMEMQAEYKDDLLNGNFQVWEKDGKVLASGTFEDGAVSSMHASKMRNGFELTSDYVGINGNNEEYWQFRADDQLILDAHFLYGEDRSGTWKVYSLVDGDALGTAKYKIDPEMSDIYWTDEMPDEMPDAKPDLPKPLTYLEKSNWRYFGYSEYQIDLSHSGDFDETDLNNNPALGVIFVEFSSYNENSLTEGLWEGLGDSEPKVVEEPPYQEYVYSKSFELIYNVVSAEIEDKPDLMKGDGEVDDIPFTIYFSKIRSEVVTLESNLSPEPNEMIFIYRALDPKMIANPREKLDTRLFKILLGTEIKKALEDGEKDALALTDTIHQDLFGGSDTGVLLSSQIYEALTESLD